MKKIVAVLMLMLITFSFCSCMLSRVLSSESTVGGSVQTLKKWRFQYDSRNDEYCVYFSLFNKKDEAISANANVDIRIVNSNGVEVYKSSKTVTKSDFGNYSSLLYGDEYLARIGIDPSDIALGNTSSGTVYLNIYNEKEFRFDEVSYSVSILPIDEIKLVLSHPTDIVIEQYTGKTKSILRIEDVTSSAPSRYSTNLSVTFSGTKIYGEMTAYDIVAYKVYDSEGYLITYGTVYLYNLGENDKFRDNSITLKDLTPGETYTINFFANN